jgi:hypothetical protein
MPLYSGIFTLSQASLAAKNGTWTGIAPPVVEYLIVAGGGGGKHGGGGAGGLLQGYAGINVGSSYFVTVGSGGAGAIANSGSSPATNGNNSVFDATNSGAFTGRIVATGGGGGGCAGGGGAGTAGSGGSGGGGGENASSGGSGTSGQGNTGGIGGSAYVGVHYPAGGGGGAGTIGLGPASTTVAGNGGAGISSDITGTRVVYAGGGGGGNASNGGTTGTGGIGGGGNGGGANAAGGTTNTGGGAGGTGNSNLGGTGGSGIVVIRYPDYYSAPVSTTGSPTAATIGPASISLNGTNQTLTVASNAAFAYGTSDFTWEAWIYPTSASWNSVSGNFYIIDHGSNGGTLSYYQNKLAYYNGTDGSISPAVATISSMTWTHVAVSRVGSTLRMFVNGALLTSATSNHNYAAQAVTVGNFGGGGNYYFAGYITNVRLVKGTAVYTAAFTPSAAPLTAVTGTSLLLNANHWAPFTDSSSNGFSITANNSPTVFNSSPFNWVGSGAGYRVYSWTTSGTITF